MGSTLFTAGILLAAILFAILLIVVSHKKGRNKENLKKQSILAEVVTGNNLKISEQEYLAHHLIAFDEANGALVFLDFRNNESTSNCVRLNAIKSSQVNVIMEELFEEKKGKKLPTGRRISHIQLTLNPRNSNDEKSCFNFYEVIINNIAERDYLKSRADYWQKKISNHIKN